MQKLCPHEYKRVQLSSTILLSRCSIFGISADYENLQSSERNFPVFVDDKKVPSNSDGTWHEISHHTRKFKCFRVSHGLAAISGLTLTHFN